MTKRKAETQDNLATASKSKTISLKDKAAELFLHEHYAIVSTEPGIQLLIDEYVMGVAETLVYRQNRFSIYLNYYPTSIAPHPAPNLADAVLFTDQARLDFSERFQNGESVTIDSGAIDCKYRSILRFDMDINNSHPEFFLDHRTPQAWIFIVDGLRNNRCIFSICPAISPNANQLVGHVCTYRPSFGKGIQTVACTQEPTTDPAERHLKRLIFDLNICNILG